MEYKGRVIMTAQEFAEMIAKIESLEEDVSTWQRMYFDKKKEYEKLQEDNF